MHVGENKNHGLHIVLFSGGVASFEVARRVLNRYGRENVQFWFFDTLIEDIDLYRFIDDCSSLFEVKVRQFADGRNPWEVFRDERFIGNSRVAVCNRVLKRQLLERLLKKLFPSRNIMLYFGLEPAEDNRIRVVSERWSAKGYSVDFPLKWHPVVSSQHLIEIPRKFGILPPRLYAMGFRHNNCGGACVKAGIKQWVLLLRSFPHRYLWHEGEEQKTREYLQKDVSILKDRRYGVTVPLTLKALRDRIELSEPAHSISFELHKVPLSSR